MPNDTLKQLGLTGNETKVYLACLEHSMLTISQISEKTGIYRTLVYDVIKSLMNSGIIGFVMKDNKKYFRAADPEVLIDIVSEKQRLLEETKDAIKKLVSLKAQTNELGSVEVMQGKKALKFLMGDILNSKVKQYYVLGFTGKIKTTIPEYFQWWDKERAKRGIKRIAIGADESRLSLENAPITEFKLLPKGYHIPTSTLIYGNRCFFFIPFEVEPLMFYIKNKKITEAFKSYFNLLWNLFEYILGSEQYDSVTTSLMNNHKNVRVIIRHMMIPWFLFPQDYEEFVKIRENFRKPLGMMLADKERIRKKMQAYQRLFNHGHIEFVMNKIALSNYFDILKKTYDKKKMMDIIKDKIKGLRNNRNIKIWVIDNYYSFFTTYLANDEVVSVLIHKGVMSGFRSTSKEIIDLHNKQFEEMKKIAKPLEIYLNEILKEITQNNILY